MWVVAEDDCDPTVSCPCTQQKCMADAASACVHVRHKSTSVLVSALSSPTYQVCWLWTNPADIIQRNKASTVTRGGSQQGGQSGCLRGHYYCEATHPFTHCLAQCKLDLLLWTSTSCPYTIDSQLNLNALVGVSGSSCPSHPVMSLQLPGDIAACGRCDVTIATLQVKYLTFTLPNSYGLSYSHPVVVGAPCN